LKGNPHYQPFAQRTNPAFQPFSNRNQPSFPTRNQHPTHQQVPMVNPNPTH
jgi:hypothetical protein